MKNNKILKSNINGERWQKQIGNMKEIQFLTSPL